MSLDPAAIDLEQARRRAKELLRAARAGEPTARARFARDDREPVLADAQLAVARELGHPSWPALVATVATAQQDALYHAAESDDRAVLTAAVRRGGGHLTASHALFRALDFGDVDRVRAVLEAGADVNEPYPGEPDVRGDTPLHHTVLRDADVAMIDLLVAAGADVTARDGGGLTAFAMAVRLGSNRIADRLLDHGAPDALSPTDRFFFACADALQDDGDDARRLRPEATIVERDRFVPLTAARRGNSPALAVLLDLAFDVDVTDSHHRATLLHWGAWHGQIGVVRLLLARGADRHAKTEFGTPLDWARHGATSGEAIGSDHGAVIALLTHT